MGHHYKKSAGDNKGKDLHCSGTTALELLPCGFKMWTLPIWLLKGLNTFVISFHFLGGLLHLMALTWWHFFNCWVSTLAGFKNEISDKLSNIQTRYLKNFYQYHLKKRILKVRFISDQIRWSDWTPDMQYRLLHVVFKTVTHEQIHKCKLINTLTKRLHSSWRSLVAA